MIKLAKAWIKRLIARFRKPAFTPNPPRARIINLKDKAGGTTNVSYLVVSPGRPVRFKDGVVKHLNRATRRLNKIYGKR